MKSEVTETHETGDSNVPCELFGTMDAPTRSRMSRWVRGAMWRCEVCGVKSWPGPNVLTAHHLDGNKWNLLPCKETKPFYCGTYPENNVCEHSGDADAT